jgi:hypothetical protein
MQRSSAASHLRSQIPIFGLAAGWDFLPRGVWPGGDRDIRCIGSCCQQFAAQKEEEVEMEPLSACGKSQRTQHAARLRTAGCQSIRPKTNRPAPVAVNRDLPLDPTKPSSSWIPSSPFVGTVLTPQDFRSALFPLEPASAESAGVASFSC